LDWWIEGTAVFSARPGTYPACTCAVANEPDLV